MKTEIIFNKLEYELIDGIYQCCYSIIDLSLNFKAKFYYQHTNEKCAQMFVEQIEDFNKKYELDILNMLDEPIEYKFIYSDFNKIECFDLNDNLCFTYINCGYDQYTVSGEYHIIFSNDKIYYYINQELVATNEKEYLQYKKLNNIS